MKTRDVPQDPILDLCGDLDGLPADLSANFDHYLDLTYGPKPGESDTPAP
jgi:hypothetical protein